LKGAALKYPHQPVLPGEVVRLLITEQEGIYVDGTVGSGGHSEAIGKRIKTKGRLICLDRDSEAIRISRGRLSSFGNRVCFVKGNFAELNEIIHELGFEKVHGVFLDLGMSSFQLEQSNRGFSFNQDEPLDMRMDASEETTAYHLINQLAQKDIERILKDYGEEKRAKAVAKLIARERKIRSVDTSLQLADLIKSVVPPSRPPRAKHPATRTFQALRIAVNRELENLEVFLGNIPSLIQAGGRLVILSYHSLEDRRVKQTMVGWEKRCHCPPDLPVCACEKRPLFKRLMKKGIRPSQEEIKANPRARSALLRAAERI
jgi:16S rRNA (cytosine1402-N4)-methyltransferase